MTTNQFALDIEGDLHDIRHLANAIFALADGGGVHSEPIACLAMIISKNVDTLQKQRAVAAGQSAPLTPAEHSA